MSLPSWPATLPPHPRQQGYRETAPDTQIRDSVDAGVDVVRARPGASAADIQAQVVVDGTQRAAFLTWWRETLRRGTQRWEWPEMHGAGTGTPVLRFTGTQWRLTPAAGGRWMLQMTLEELPS